MPIEDPCKTPQTPADTAAVAEAMRAANAQRLAVYPIGGGTMLDGQGGRRWLSAEVPENGKISLDNHLRPRPGIALSTAKLNRVIDYPADDMTVTVEAGVTITDLNKLLAEKRQWLPVNVSFPDRATVGGAIATNAAGPRRYAYSSMRDYLLGFTAVDATGMAFSGGGRVVKNAAGYNMCRLMAGSRGTLAVVTQATLMVRPLPEASALLACDVSDFDTAEKLLASLVGLPVYPVAIELLAGRPHEGDPLFDPLPVGSVCRLVVGFEGSAVEVEWMLARLRGEWVSLAATTPVPMTGVATAKFWQWMAECPADATIDVLPSHLVATVAELLKQLPDCSIQAHAGNGTIRMKRAIADESAAAASTPRETGDAAVPSPEMHVMRAIKERFDPANILNPGILFA